MSLASSSLSSHVARLFLSFRLQHGHSSGLHCHITSTEQLTSSLRLVFEDVASLDADEGRPSPSSTFFAGASLGAFVILKYLVEYPPDVEENQSIEGCYLMVSGIS
jgi:alpha-beta hydrolase superfamily lysophospholipase